MKLLTVSNPKTARGVDAGYLTAILHLAPATAVGTFNVTTRLGTLRAISPNLCAKATDGCRAACLNTAGRGGMGLEKHGTNAIQEARARKTRAYFEDRPAFLAQLVKDVASVVRTAARKGLTPAVRLNGTSDIQWERVAVTRDGAEFPNIFAAFPDVQFYDYTKLPARDVAGIPNYHLTFSLADGNEADAERALARGLNVAVVLRDPARPNARHIELPAEWKGRRLVSGDETDLRFLDPPGGCYVGLRAKGRAVRDTTGFVHDLEVAA